MRILVQSLAFVSGFVSNLVCQTLRCVFNLAGFALLSLLGALGMIVGILRIAGGGGKKGSELCRSSWSKIRKAACMLASATLQFLGVASLVTPLLRAAQASSESFTLNGLYAPARPNRSQWQALFGLNSWKEPEPAKATSKPKKTATPSAKPRLVEELPTIEQPAPKKRRPKPQEEEWATLADMYIRCRTQSEADRIRLKMATRHPRRYLAALNATERRGNFKATA